MRISGLVLASTPGKMRTPFHTLFLSARVSAIPLAAPASDDCASPVCRPSCTSQMSSITTATRQCHSLSTRFACGHGHSTAQTGISAEPSCQLQLSGSTSHTMQERMAVQACKHVWPQHLRQHRPCSILNCPQW